MSTGFLVNLRMHCTRTCILFSNATLVPCKSRLHYWSDSEFFPSLSLYHLVARGNLQLHPVSELDDCLGKWDDCCELRMHLSFSLRYILFLFLSLFTCDPFVSLTVPFSTFYPLRAIQLRTQDTWQYKAVTRNLMQLHLDTWVQEGKEKRDSRKRKREREREREREKEKERDIAQSVSRGALVHHM